MSETMLNKIKDLNKEAASALEGVDYRTDSELQSLTREDLRDLFPGSEHFKMRRDIFEIINRKRPSGVLTLHDSAKVDDILKSMKTQMDQVFDVHIGRLEELIKNGPLSGPSTSNAVLPHNGQPQETGTHPGSTGGHSQGTPNTDSSMTSAGGILNKFSSFSSMWSPTQPSGQVKCQIVVSGKTFGAHQHLMDKVTSQFKDQVQVIGSTEDARITILFCPICSRVGSDVEAAMADVKDVKPVILVLMHHSREAKATTSMRTWKSFDQVVMHVNVFYHETVPGLLQCDDNKRAVSEIGNKLLEYKEVISENTMGVGSQSIPSGRTHRGNNKGSDTNSGGSIFDFSKHSWPWSDK